MDFSLERIVQRLSVKNTERNFSFAQNTTIGIGGNAPLAVFPENIAQLAQALEVLNGEGARWLVLGAGANVLASDNGFQGVVIKTDRLNAIDVADGLLCAECGVRISSLLRYAQKKGLGGLSFMAGIPASVGGAVLMNAGVAEGHIGDRIRSVTVLEPDGKIRKFLRDECRFSYKRTLFSESSRIILNAELSLERRKSEEIGEEIRTVFENRKRLPAGRSMGCVFKNPPGVSAGALIEQAGLKGAREGGAVVSERHANFIINSGGATAENVRTLIERIRSEVCRIFHVSLEEEIRYIGDF